MQKNLSLIQKIFFIKFSYFLNKNKFTKKIESVIFAKFHNWTNRLEPQKRANNVVDGYLVKTWSWRKFQENRCLWLENSTFWIRNWGNFHHFWLIFLIFNLLENFLIHRSRVFFQYKKITVGFFFPLLFLP